MNHLTFLFYILSRCISSIKPSLIEALQDWPNLNPDINLLQIDPVNFCKAMNLNQDQTQKFFDFHNNRFLLEKLRNEFFESLEINNIQAINIFMDSYPAQLLETPDPPLILYCRGKNIKLLGTRALAMIGSRRASGYGKLVVDKLIHSFAGSDVTIISGLAYGIDALTHQAAIKNNLPTIAVLGSGIDTDHIYPKANFNLAMEILNANGILISEYPPYTPAVNYQFVARNRIIAGLSQATIIVEAAARSGALLTADFALQYNRSVFAVPNQIFSEQSKGVNKLIQQGAQIITSEEDLLAEFNLDKSASTPNNLSFSSTQLAVLKCMQSGETVELENLVAKSGLNLPQVLSALTELELNNIIIQTSPQIYQKVI